MIDLLPPRHLLRPLVAATVLSALAACATAPLSFLNDRQVTYRAPLHRVPVIVDAVDGISPGFRPVQLTPGEHLVRMHAPPVAGFSQTIDKTVAMSIEPCTRYYIAGQRVSALSQEWNLVIEQTFPVAGCDKDQELRKAHIATVSPSFSTPTSSLESIAPVAQTAAR